MNHLDISVVADPADRNAMLPVARCKVCRHAEGSHNLHEQRNVLGLASSNPCAIGSCSCERYAPDSKRYKHRLPERPAEADAFYKCYS